MKLNHEEKERLEIIKDRILRKVLKSLIHYHRGEWQGSTEFIISENDYKILSKSLDKI